jgi:hypothetical protein
MNTLCGQNAEIYYSEPGGTYSNQWAKARSLCGKKPSCRPELLLNFRLSLKDILLRAEGHCLADRYTWPNFAARIEVV